MTNEIVNELKDKLYEYSKQKKILGSLKSDIERLAYELNEEIQIILDFDGQVFYDPLMDKIRLFSFSPDKKPKKSDLIKVQELLKANDSDFTSTNKEATITLFYY